MHLKRGVGEILGVVGELGCGESTVALSVMRLIRRLGKVVGGEICFEGEDLLSKSEVDVR